MKVMKLPKHALRWSFEDNITVEKLECSIHFREGLSNFRVCFFSLSGKKVKAFVWTQSCGTENWVGIWVCSFFHPSFLLNLLVLNCKTSTSIPGSQTLPRNLSGSRDDVSDASRVSGAHSSSSVYDNVKRNESRMANQAGDGYGSVREADRTRLSQRDISRSADQSGRGTPRQPGGFDSTRNRRGRNELMNSKSVDYHDSRQTGGGHRASISMGSAHQSRADHVRRMRSKSTDQLHHPEDRNCSRFDSGTLKRMLKPVQTAPESPVTSPEGGRRGKTGMSSMSGKQPNNGYHPVQSSQRYDSDREGGFMSEPEPAGNRVRRNTNQAQPVDMANNTYRDIGRTSTGNNQFYKTRGGNGAMRNPNNRSLYLDFNEQGVPRDHAGSPPSDSGGIFDSHCFATTPSSSNGNSDLEGNDTTRASPTSQLLMDYEEHLRNTLEKGMDAESYSLHTFEALLTRSMENLGKTARLNQNVLLGL